MKHILTALLILTIISTGCTAHKESSSNDETVTSLTEISTEASAETVTTVPDEDSTAFEYDGDMAYNTDEKYSVIVQELKEQYGYIGDVKGVFLAADDEEIIFTAFTNSYERDGVTKINEFTTFEIGSVTKMFTASAVLMLREQGKLQLYDTLGKYYPEYKDTPAGKITIYQLLHMQSGLYDMDHIMSKYIPEDADEDLKARAEKWDLTDDDFTELVFAKELKTEPGTLYEYCNTNYKFLALIVEKITGQSFAGFVKENIFDKCGMEHSSIAAQGDVTSVPRNTVLPYCTYTDFIRGAGDMHSCAFDLIAFDRALFAGELLNKGSLEEMFNMDKTYGCGWYIEKEHPKHFMHTGKVGNYLTLSAVYNTEKYGRIYLVELCPNNDNDTMRTMMRIYDSLRLEIDK